MTAEFRASRAGTLHGFAGWFVADLGNGQFLSTSPRQRSTHWGQVFFPSGAPRCLRRGEQMRFVLRLRGSNRHRHWSWSGSIDRRNGQQGENETFAHQATGLA
jgi:protein arginine N-methyltransferase 1